MEGKYFDRLRGCHKHPVSLRRTLHKTQWICWVYVIISLFSYIYIGFQMNTDI